MGVGANGVIKKPLLSALLRLIPGVCMTPLATSGSGCRIFIAIPTTNASKTPAKTPAKTLQDLARVGTGFFAAAGGTPPRRAAVWRIATGPRRAAATTPWAFGF